MDLFECYGKCRENIYGFGRNHGIIRLTLGIVNRMNCLVILMAHNPILIMWKVFGKAGIIFIDKYFLVFGNHVYLFL